jgi:hypothetical protein
MTIDELTQQQSIIDEDAKKLAGLRGRTVICDGVISPRDYLNAKYKIAWLLREPNEIDKNCAYDHKGNIVNRIQKGGLRKNRYFDPMRYLDYSLNHNYLKYRNIPKTDTSLEVTNLLLKVAFINESKIIGGSQINKEYIEHKILFRNILKKQIELYSPDIIIACGTIDSIKELGILGKSNPIKKNYRNCYVSNNKIILDCYHPAQRKIKQERYCDDMIDCIERMIKGKFVSYN